MLHSPTHCRSHATRHNASCVTTPLGKGGARKPAQHMFSSVLEIRNIDGHKIQIKLKSFPLSLHLYHKFEGQFQFRNGLAFQTIDDSAQNSGRK